MGVLNFRGNVHIFDFNTLFEDNLSSLVDILQPGKDLCHDHRYHLDALHVVL